MKWVITVALSLSMIAALAAPASGQDFRKWEAQTAKHKQWLDSVGPGGSQLWLRLDEKQRPHRLYLGDAFFRSDHQTQERFVETFSTYLAGHPEKFMLIDLFDARTRKTVGEFGWGGFKLYKK